MKRYEIGDKVYFTKSFKEIFWQLYYKTPPEKRKHPLEKKITQIVRVGDEILYQVKDGHFPDSWIGKIVFDTKEEAYIAIKEGENA
jgi:hypothetical protein